MKSITNIIAPIVIIVVIFLDITGLFSFTDLSFIIAIGVFLLLRPVRITSLLISIFFLLLMGLSYIPTGAGQVTERLGEWFYIFFLFGLFQYTHESQVVESDKSMLRNTHIDWDEYYYKRIGSEHIEDAIRHSENQALWYINWLGYINKKIAIYSPRLRTFEIGSGLGGVITLLHRHNVPITGSDVSKGVVASSKKIRPDVPYVLCNVESLVPYKTPYDRILAFEVLEHLAKLDVSIKNIYNALRKGGYFIGTTPYPYRHFVSMPTHINVHGPMYWKSRFRTCGFTSVITYPMSLPPFLWRIHPKLNIVFPFYIPFSGWISTTLIIAKK